MIDLVLYAANKAAIRTFALNRGLLVDGGIVDGQQVPDQLADGVQYCWWAGSGKFMTADGDPPSYLPGVVAILRINRADDRHGTGPDQWSRSKVAQAIRENGTQGTMGGITYYEWDGVRLFRPQDVQNWLTTKGLPGHEWAGGNTY